MDVQAYYLEGEFLAERRRGETNLVRGGRAAGEADDVSTRMSGQCLARVRSAAEHHVHHARRQTCSRTMYRRVSALN